MRRAADGERPAVVLASRAADPDHLATRSITTVDTPTRRHDI
jgi:hypothetical protein